MTIWRRVGEDSLPEMAKNLHLTGISARRLASC